MSVPMKEVQARRQLELARETLVSEKRTRAALVGLSLTSAAVVITGVALTALVSWPFVFMAIIAFFVGCVTTTCAFVQNVSEVQTARKGWRQAEWDYEDAVMNEVSS